MPAQRPVRPATRARVVAPVNGDEMSPLAQRMLADSVQRTADQLRDRAVVVRDLFVGANVINHGLGRKPRGAAVSPTVANATWAWALTAADARQATITCIGVAQPGAAVEFY